MVSQDTVRTAIGFIGNLTSFGLFLSPVPTFMAICSNGSVQQYSLIPYMMSLLNCMIWALYGIVHPDSMLVIIINSIGVAIEVVYVGLFIRYSAGTVRRNAVVLLATVGLVVVFVAGLVFGVAHGHERRSMVFGILGIISGTAMYASPLSIMKTVMETGSVEYLPLPMSVASFANAILWTAYAFIPFDLYIAIPNMLGALLAVVQLVLYAIYCNREAP